MPPSRWVERFAALVPAGARVLDLACGRGRHARLFAARGAQVLAVDRDQEALATLDGVPGLATRVLDLEAPAWPLAGEKFDAVVVTNYLYRPHFEALLDAVSPEGVLVYETFARGNEAFGRPSNPAFLLEPGELAARAGTRLFVVAFEQGVVVTPGRSAVLQRIVAVGRGRPWPVPLPAGDASLRIE